MGLNYFAGTIFAAKPWSGCLLAHQKTAAFVAGPSGSEVRNAKNEC